jgi:hypothetical protein
MISLLRITLRGNLQMVVERATHRLSPDASTDRQNPDTSPPALQSFRPSVPRPPVIQSSQFPRPPGPTASVPARAAVSFAPSESDPWCAQAVSSLGLRQAHSPLAELSPPSSDAQALRKAAIARRAPRAARPANLQTLPTAGRPGHATSTSPTSPLGADPDPGPRRGRSRPRLPGGGLRAPANKTCRYSGGAAPTSMNKRLCRSALF